MSVKGGVSSKDWDTLYRAKEKLEQRLDSLQKDLLTARKSLLEKEVKFRCVSVIRLDDSPMSRAN